MKVEIDKKKFTNCLRAAVVPGWHEEERVQNIKEYCLRYGFSNVMLFLNAEEYNVGHMTIEEAEPWVRAIQRAKCVLNGAGISVSLNPWNSILHLDRGKTLARGQNWTTMTDQNGTRCGCVVCMLDEDWRRYYREFLSYLIRETEPEVFWVEDDFRLHNHDPLEYGGCFCERHMERYNEKLDASYSREEFVANMLAGGDVNPFRTAWLDVSREVMTEFAEEIGNTVKNCGTKTAVGLMSSDPKVHCLEARDWNAVMDGLSAGGVKIDRIHLPCYEEDCGKRYYWRFHATSMLTRAFLPPDTLIYPELENGAFSTFTKDSRFLRFQLESALPLILSGMTYDIYDFLGNGAVASFGYGEAISEINAYLQGFMDLKRSFSDLTGVVIPIDERSCYRLTGISTARIADFTPEDAWFAGFLGTAGVNYRYDTGKAFHGEIVALSGQNPRNFTGEQLTALFLDNYVLLDGAAALTLCDMGYGGLIDAVSAEVLPADSNRQTYEQAVAGYRCNGIDGLRASAQKRAGDYVRIRYDGDVSPLTELYGNRGQYVGTGIVCGKQFAVLPYLCKDILLEQMHPLRVESVKLLLQNRECSAPLVFTDYEGVSPFLYGGEFWTLVLTNSTVNSFSSVSFRLKGISPEKIEALDCETGKARTVPFLREADGRVRIEELFPYLSTETLLLWEGKE